MSSKDESFNASNPHLSGVSSKMHRAWDHIQEVDCIIQPWVNSNPWAISTERNSKGRPERLVFRLNSQVPAKAGPVIGDAIHNIRSALDHLAAASAIRAGRSAKGVYFPIVKDAAAIEAAIRDKLRKCPEAFRDFVADLKPYKGGNDALYVLHHLDIIDKHQVLSPIGAGSKVTIDADQGFYGAIDFSKTTEPIRLPRKRINDGDTVLDYSASLAVPDGTEIRTQTEILVEFVEETSPAVGKEIKSVLHWIFRETERIIMWAEIRHFR